MISRVRNWSPVGPACRAGLLIFSRVQNRFRRLPQLSCLSPPRGWRGLKQGKSRTQNSTIHFPLSPALPIEGRKISYQFKPDVQPCSCDTKCLPAGLPDSKCRSTIASDAKHVRWRFEFKIHKPWLEAKRKLVFLFILVGTISDFCPFSWLPTLFVNSICQESCCFAVEPQSIAFTIDEHFADAFRSQDVVPAPAADDAEFLRRVHLDLIGIPPNVDVIRSFLADSSPDKRTRIVNILISDPKHADHFAVTWRALLLPEATNDAQLRYFQPGLESWLRQKAIDRIGFDKIVRELLCVPIAGPEAAPQMVLRDLKQPNPIAFVASKGGDPATIAASAIRLFLGVRLECAQCHDHPFENWTQTQFWNQAAFFAGIERRGRSPFSPLVEDPGRREIKMMDKSETVMPILLNGDVPSIDSGMTPRTTWANWMTSKDNERFSQAIVNRLWGQLMGEGFVTPVDDFGTGNAPSHPELLNELARNFVNSDFQLQTMYAGICLSHSYQRTSRTTDPSQEMPGRFARMNIKPMSGEQFFATVAQAIDYQPPVQSQGAGRGDDPVRRRILNEFATAENYSDPETSVSQALMLMNSSLINDAIHRRNEEPIQESVETMVESLFLKVLCRPPRSEEIKAIESYMDQADDNNKERQIADILWSLLNTAEFRWNH
ncbi:MAG: DUF1553 domain-containing protein [Planctomycetes bacterium]|nr:DUF1553 domain-containing protein [Planctomycetota bacterium]